jgi:dihydrofolate reductase
MSINIIVAYCKNRGIGINNQLPWNLSEDLKRFSKITKGTGNNAIIMGRNTYESIGRTLPHRFNIVLSTTQQIQGVKTCNSLESAIILCKNKNINDIFIIGGQCIYNEALNKNIVHNIYATEINKDYVCDCFFPYISEQFITHQENKSINGIDVCYKTYTLSSAQT